MAEAYPLAWPDGWPRTKPTEMKDGRFTFATISAGRSQKTALTFVQARTSLLNALGKLGARDIVLSTNFVLNSLDLPHGGRNRPVDEGVAVYFKRKGRHLVLAQDRYWRAEENMRSLAIALEAMATLERHGGDLITERAFTGFAALPPPPSCWEILGVERAGATPSDVNRAFRLKSGQLHPDVAGGDEEAFKRLTAARSDALRVLEGPSS